MKALEKISSLLGVTTDVALAKALGHKNSGKISVWRTRGNVPMSVLREWSQTYGKSVEWFLSDDGVEKEQPQLPEHLRLLHAEIDRVILGGKDVAEQYDIASKILKLLRES